jgi:hypothetical protein
MRLSLFILGVFAVIVPPLCSPLVPIKNKIKLTGAEHEKLLCWHWFVVRGRGRRIQEEIKITLTLRLVVVAGERRDVGCHPWGDRYPDR